MAGQAEHVEFWTKYEDSWRTPLRLLDVKTALDLKTILIWEQ